MRSRAASLQSSRSIMSEARKWLSVVRELRESPGDSEIEHRLVRLIDAMPGMVYECANDPTWRMGFASSWSRNITGYPASDFLEGKVDLGSLIEPEDRERVWQEVQQALEDRTSFNIFYRIHTAEGDLRWVWDRGEGVFDRDGCLQCLEGFICDVTDDIRMREEFFHLQKLEAVERLAEGIAHDFRNLLTGIFASIDMYQVLGPENADPEVVMQEVGSLAERASKLTNRLAGLVGRRPTGRRKVELNELLSQTKPVLEILKPRDVQLVVSTHAGNSTIHADPSQLEQVVLNLAINGFEAMPEGGTLHIETFDSPASPDESPAHPSVLLTVRDSGKGIDAETLSGIFQPFFSTKESTGLGLSVVHAIVTQHGGVIKASSEQGQGSTFQIFFPVE